MTKIHKDIAMRLMECVNDEEYSDQAIVKVSIILSSVECVKNVLSYSWVFSRTKILGKRKLLHYQCILPGSKVFETIHLVILVD